MVTKQATAVRNGQDRPATVSVATRVAALDWTAMASSLDAEGCARTGPLLTADECAALAATYPSDAPFRSRVVMARHGFGRGEYKCFAYPLPDLVLGLRSALYSRLAAIANRSTLSPGALRAWLTDTHPPMPNLNLSNQQMDDIAAYLDSLRKR